MERAELRDLQRVRQARAEQVAFVVQEHLRLVDQPPERRANERCGRDRAGSPSRVGAGCFGMAPAARPGWIAGVGRRAHVRPARATAQPRAAVRDHLAHHGVGRAAHDGRPGRSMTTKLDLAGLGLLVDLHQFEVAVGAERRAPTHRQARRVRSARDALDEGRIDQPRRCDRCAGHHHAAAHRLAVQPLAIAQAGFDRVAEGVAEIEDGAQAAIRARPARPPRP